MNTHSVPVTTMDAQLRERAERVIPNGMWGHQRASSLPQGYPQYFASGKDACVTDVDGNSYIDFMCAWGRSSWAIAIRWSMRQRCLRLSLATA